MHGPTCIFWANLTAFSLQCSNVPTAHMMRIGVVCSMESAPWSLTNNCVHDPGWTDAKVCQRACFEAGLGYGEKCCPSPDICKKCSNDRNQYMTESGKDCMSWPWGITNNCRNDAGWRAGKTCEHTCELAGLGYDERSGRKCCPVAADTQVG